jgi:hypothetical protein
VIGGTLSKLSGGKFANGAVTAAMSYAFNQLAHHHMSADGGGGETAEDRMLASVEYDPNKAMAFHWPSLPQGLVDGVAGFGDALSLGISRYTREAYEIGSVDYDSTAYTVGEVGAFAYSTAFGGAVGLRMAGRATRGLGANPFKGKTARQIAETLEKRGYVPRGPDPAAGRGTYVNPNTGRGYHIDASHAPPKGPHVGVHRPRHMRDTLPPRDYPLERP